MSTVAAAYVKSQLRTKKSASALLLLLLLPVHISEVGGVGGGGLGGRKGVEPCLSFLKYKTGQSRRVLETEVVNEPLVALVRREPFSWNARL